MRFKWFAVGLAVSGCGLVAFFMTSNHAWSTPPWESLVPALFEIALGVGLVSTATDWSSLTRRLLWLWPLAGIALWAGLGFPLSLYGIAFAAIYGTLCFALWLIAPAVISLAVRTARSTQPR